MTYLEAQMELEGILADLAFSAKVIFSTIFYQKILIQKKVISVQNIFLPNWDADKDFTNYLMVHKSINAVILNIHFLGRCQRSRRPPTTLSLCQASRDAAPPVQHCVDFTCAWFITELLHAVKLITTPCSENSGKRLRGRSHKMIGIPIGVWPNHLRSREVDWLNRVIRIIIISRMFCSG